MASFTSKPESVEAVQLTKSTRDEVQELAGPSAVLPSSKKTVSAKVYGKAGTQVAGDGDWIIKHSDGSLSVMKSEEFDRSFTKGSTKAGGK